MEVKKIVKSISPELNQLINEQIVHELRNSNIYKQIWCLFEDKRLSNIGKYFKNQSKQEFEHSELFTQHLNDRVGGKVTLLDIPPLGISINSIEEVGDAFLTVEQETTERINKILELAIEQNSGIDKAFLLKMLDEQVEEENIADEFRQRMAAVTDFVLFDATFKED